MKDPNPDSLMCRVGLHHIIVVNEDNPENRGGTHRQCVRCGKIKDDIDRSAQEPGWITSRPKGWGIVP